MSTPETRYGFGSPATEEQIAGWNIDIAPDGAGLPPGSGSVAQGKELYDLLAAECHGAKGEGGAGPPLVGGLGSLATDAPVKTVGSFWPYATTLYDYIHRAMPPDNPQSLQPDELYALCAYILFLNDIIPEDAVMDAQTLPQVVMPNHAGFTSPDPRPEVFTTVEAPVSGSAAAEPALR